MECPIDKHQCFRKGCALGVKLGLTPEYETFAIQTGKLLLEGNTTRSGVLVAVAMQSVALGVNVLKLHSRIIGDSRAN